MPVAVAPINRQRRPVPVELGHQRHQQAAVLGVDRADALEEVVVLGDLLHTLGGNILAAEHVLQKRQHVVPFFRAAEGDQQQGVVGMAHGTSMGCPQDHSEINQGNSSAAFRHLFDLLHDRPGQLANGRDSSGSRQRSPGPGNRPRNSASGRLPSPQGSRGRSAAKPDRLRRERFVVISATMACRALAL